MNFHALYRHGMRNSYIDLYTDRSVFFNVGTYNNNVLFLSVSQKQNTAKYLGFRGKQCL